jgi:hypothetical protein
MRVARAGGPARLRLLLWWGRAMLCGDVVDVNVVIDVSGRCPTAGGQHEQQTCSSNA